jgi:hypothetical protein
MKSSNTNITHFTQPSCYCHIFQTKRKSSGKVTYSSIIYHNTKFQDPRSRPVTPIAEGHMTITLALLIGNQKEQWKDDH